ncbi:MAG: ABC transporter permease [Candidatus Melainabacteria bacterium]|nr:ABC transporter permease [Candidatus Melainabacteria bacterium]
MSTSSITNAPFQSEAVAVESGLSELWIQRHLLTLMVKRDCLGRYKGSLLGLLWPLINPFGHLLLYTFLFCIVLKVKLGTSASTSNFALYLMAGLLPWGAFAEALARSSTVILEHPNLVKRVVFPLQILPLVTVLSAFFTEAIAFTILLTGVLIYNHGLPASLIFLPLIIISQLLLTAGISWFVASLSVYIRDIRHLMALGLSAWMYSTPIVYPATALPEQIQFILWINPMAGIVLDYRRVVLEGLPPDWLHYGVYTAVALVVCLIGFKFFEATKKSFADVM